MKITFFTFLFCIVATVVFAQRPFQGGGPRAKLHAFKVAYITETLALNSQDSTKFWGIYNQYEEEKKDIRKQMKRIAQGLIAKPDEQLKKDLDTFLSLKQKEVEVEKKYINEFLKVINIRQVAALYQAENQIKKKILERFGEFGQGMEEE
jgi:glutamyl/glutaminyl-tRNA synthetase